MISTKTVAQQALVYVYNLNNCAKEFGFKAEEGWELSLASQFEKAEIEKKYYPTVSAKVLPEILGQLFNMVKTILKQVKSGISNAVDPNTLSTPSLQYLVAYNPNRLRR